MKNRLVLYILLSIGLVSCNQEPVYKPVSGWSQEVNNKLQNFLNSTISSDRRKVAVFDSDGTTFGQVPFYLADEALFQYADEVLKKRNDNESREKLAILDRMVENGDNVSKKYIEDRVHFLTGLTPEEIGNIGNNCYLKSYKEKFFPEMKELIYNLKEYGFEIWIITGSPEFLYQKFVVEELGIQDICVIGAKCVIKNGVTTDEIIQPIPQDDGKAFAIETFIKTRPLIVAGNSRGDMDMLNCSDGLKIVVNPDDVTVRGPEDGPMNGFTVKSYWEKEGALIVRCNDVAIPGVKYHTYDWNIRPNRENPK